MRNVLLLALLAPLAACELQPGPPRPTAQSAPTAPTPPAPMPPAPTPTDPPANVAPTKKEPVVITPQCLEVATHVAGVIIASADPAQRSIFETERDRIVRSTGEVCTVQRWSEAAARCYKASSTQADLKACEVKFPTQPVQRPQPPASDAQPVTNGGMRPEPGAAVVPGAGSAAPARPGATGAGTSGTPAVPNRPTPRPSAAGAGSGSAAPVRPTPSPAAPVRPTPSPAAPAGAGSAAPAPAGGLMPPRAGSAAR